MIFFNQKEANAVELLSLLSHEATVTLKDFCFF